MSVAHPSVPPYRTSSRPNSTSSSTTVKKSASLSTKGPRTSLLRGRSTSPDSISRVLHTLNSSRQDLPTRSDSSERRRHAAGPNTNRWSHSASSSFSGLDADLIKRRTSSSGATRRSIASFSMSGSGTSAQGLNLQKAPSQSTATKASDQQLDNSRPNPDSSSNTVQVSAQRGTVETSLDFFDSTWERRAIVNKSGQPVQGVSLQYTADAGLSNGTMQNATADRKPSPSRSAHRNRSSEVSKGASTHSLTSVKSDQSKGRGHRSPKQKDMLSKALAQANAAVLLDNAQNISGAIEAYNEACVLLEQVMVRSSDADDRRKLSAIRTTYSQRIAELHDLDNSFADLTDKSHLDYPPSDDYDQPEDYYHNTSQLESFTDSTLILDLPLRQESLLPQLFGGDEHTHGRSLPTVREATSNPQLRLPMDAQYMPSPLTPRHPPSPQPLDVAPVNSQTTEFEPAHLVQTKESASSTSWLAQSDISSSKSSSRLSSIDFGPGNDLLISDIQAEFDAALNAAVDAAYDDDLSQEPTPRVLMDNGRPVLHGESADLPTHHSSVSGLGNQTSMLLDNEAKEEERLLDEFTKGHKQGASHPDGYSTKPPPRESDSSGFSSRTWDSSVASTAATSGTALSTLAEAAEPTAIQPNVESSPDVSSSRISQPAAPSQDRHVPIRDRRLSGQSAKQLKIETFTRRPSIGQVTQVPAIPTPVIEVPREETQSENPSDVPIFTSPLSAIQPLTPLTSITSADSHHGESPATPALTLGGSVDDSVNIPPSPARIGKMMPPPPSLMRKNVSTSGLKKGSLSINTTPEMPETPITPNSGVSSELRRHPSNVTPAVSTPGGILLTQSGAGGMHLFEDYTGRAGDDETLSTKNLAITIEACPESFLLRPFWLMRTLAAALLNPKGGFVTQKLYLSADIWRVRTVKLKAVEDKIAACDLLTAALQKLSRVDTLDANAMLEEVQSLEAVLDQARTTLSKKLGSEVGLAGTASFFKNSPVTDDGTEALPAKSANSSLAAKSFASGWRKLRSKSSSTALNGGGTTSHANTSAHSFTMSSLPMTTSSSVATSRSYMNRTRDASPVLTPGHFAGMPSLHVAYVTSLTRLFTAVQVLDSVARQVEDPGLKYSDKTQVGLDFSIRNAAEFFAFYIIRFVMSDLSMLVDKYVKRSTEWVMT